MSKLLLSLVFKCSSAPQLSGNAPYFNFLKKDLKHLQLVAQKVRNRVGQRVNVPFKTLPRQQVIKFFQQNSIKDKNIIVDVDSSHLLGIKKMLILQHLRKNVYQGVEQPLQALTNTNPEFQNKMQQIHFDDNIFFMTDPKFVHLWQTDKDQQQIDAIVQDYYDKHIQRGYERLKYDYKLPEQFLYIIQTAHNFDNKIYFGGMNQFDLRNVLWLYYTVDQLKSTFIRAMHYWKNTQKFLESQNSIKMIDFQNKCRQFLHQQNYHLIQPFRYNRLKILRQSMPHSLTFGHSFAFQKAGMQTMNIELGKAHSAATQSDKLQKHAILQVMLGNLWGQPYSMNKFPYLSQFYNKLNSSDKQTVDGIFHKNCNIYMKAIEIFRDKHFKEMQQKLKSQIQGQSIQ